ncbi:MAG: phytanoyl-CoA dioxygenase family protein [Proteobacteria bacterium]|jgi:hypothetical protein|nr:phytanoyl-CoA dioxygenase family protein [Pseudomonadota bacterium]
MQWAHPIEQSLEQLDLVDHADDLKRDGLTIVPLSRTGFTMADVEVARQALLAAAYERTGHQFRIDETPCEEIRVKASPTARQRNAMTSEFDRLGANGYLVMVYMLQAHPIFRDLVTNPVVNTLHRFMLGDDFRLTTSNGFVKWAHPEGSWGKYYGLHCDSPLVEPANARFAANCNWFLTDCEADDGPLCYLPGTHRTGKHPQGNVTPELLAQVRPVEAEAGSLVIFDSTMWHGSWPRSKPGLRLTTHTQRRVPLLTPLSDFSGLGDELIEGSKDPEVMRMLCWR